MSTRPSRDWMNSCGIMGRLSARELCLYQSRYFPHICTARELRLDDAHHLAHVGGAFRTRRGDGLGDDRVDLGLRELPREVLLDHGDLVLLLVGEVLARGLLVLRDGVLALLDHLFHHA